MDTYNTHDDSEERFLSPEARCGVCGRPLRLIFSKRLERYAINPRCECGTVTEISSDELAAKIVQILEEHYGIDKGIACTAAIESRIGAKL